MSDDQKYSKISNRVRAQMPSQLRDDNPLWADLMEAYYDYLEVNKSAIQSGRVVERAKNIRNYNDVDLTVNDFLLIFYKQFLSFLPRNINADKTLLLKHAKDFYRARGTEKSYKFLIRLLSEGSRDAEFYYPKNDVLRASYSTWYIQKTLRLISLEYDGVGIDETNITNFFKFDGLKITGNTSGATAIVDKSVHFYDGGYLIDEITLSSINGTFSAGENVTTTYVDSYNVSHLLSGTINPGIVSSVQVINPGYGYSVGDFVPIEVLSGYPGTNAVVQITDVTTGSVNTITVLEGGAGYQTNDAILIVADSGSGANAFLSSVNDNGFYHPNTYLIDISTISLEAETQIGNSVYTNLNSSNANTTVENSVSTFAYTNTGPAAFVTVDAFGQDYESIPTLSVVANTLVQALGILGKMNVVSRGLDYAVGEELIITNISGGHGVGATGNITSVAANGAILNVAFQQVTGFPIGGLGYDQDHLPSVSINTVSGTGGEVDVVAVLGFGANLKPSLTTIGGILELSVISGGTGYNVAPTVNLIGLGSGTATANANVSLGLFSYEGRYLDDTGHVSAYNFLQDADYYQNFSYVIRTDESLDNYRRSIMKLLHPAGLALFAEYLDIQPTINLTSNIENANIRVGSSYIPNTIYFDGSTYFKTNNETIGSSGGAGVLSVWVSPQSFPSENERMHVVSFGSDNVGYLALVNTAYANSGSGIEVNLVLPNSSGTKVLDLKSDSNSNPIEQNTFTHILISWATNNVSKCKIWLSGVECTANVGNTTSTNIWARPNLVIGGSETGQGYVGALSELFIANTWMDFSVANNRQLFSDNLVPVNLSTGLLSNTSVIDVVYIKGTSSDANVNYGGAPNSFSVIEGTVTSSNLSPISD